VNNEVVGQISDFYQHPGKSICKSELMLLVLHMMGTVSTDDMLVAAEIFDRFDSSGTRGGKVSLADMQKVLLARRGTVDDVVGTTNRTVALTSETAAPVVVSSSSLSPSSDPGEDIELSSTMNPVNSTSRGDLTV
jgi:hypothetical protein